MKQLFFAGFSVIALMLAGSDLSAQKPDRKDSVINAMRMTIDSVQSRFEALQTQVNELRAMLLTRTATVISGASPEQNFTNPFSGATMIEYSLPIGSSSAQVEVTRKMIAAR
jgi:hypothetical protein